MHNKKMFDLENEGQDHSVQLSQWCLSMANSNHRKIRIRILAIALTVFEILIVPLCDVENLSQGHGEKHSQ